MTAAGVYASRFGRVLLADPTRQPEVFTAARARGEVALVVAARPWWVPFWVPTVAPERSVRAA